MAYHAKLLLFGEHAVIKGSPALAIPFRKYEGRWAYTTAAFKQQQLSAFGQYLENLNKKGSLLVTLNIAAFQQDLAKGLYFDANIPTGYGLGSSGSLCAAVYDCYALDKINRTETNRLNELKQQLAQLENFFHSSSSGMDPLICYLDQPTLIESTGIRLVKIRNIGANPPIQLFLLDTRISRQTGPFVEHFIQQWEDSNYKKRIQSELIVDNEAIISCFLLGEWDTFFKKFHKISAFQFDYFQKMIPSTFKELWLDGLNDDLFKLKLCGAGGGGFLLGATNDFEKVEKSIKEWELISILEHL